MSERLPCVRLDIAIIWPCGKRGHYTLGAQHMPRDMSFCLNDVTITLDEYGDVIIEWDHGDRIEVFDAGGYLVVKSNGKEMLNGEFSSDNGPPYDAATATGMYDHD